MIAALPWLLLASTLVVRVCLARKHRIGWWIDIASIPGWLTYYALHGDYQLMTIPLVFGVLDVQALRKWWAKPPETDRVDRITFGGFEFPSADKPLYSVDGRDSVPLAGLSYGTLRQLEPMTDEEVAAFREKWGDGAARLLGLPVTISDYVPPSTAIVGRRPIPPSFRAVRGSKGIPAPPSTPSPPPRPARPLAPEIHGSSPDVRSDNFRYVRAWRDLWRR